MHRFEHLRKLVQKGDAEAFASELGLDPHLTRSWFEQGSTPEGYGAEVISALGTHLLKALTARHEGGATHG